MKYIFFRLLFMIFCPFLILFTAIFVWLPRISIAFMNITLALWGLCFKSEEDSICESIINNND